MAKDDEKVLCVPRAELEQLFGGSLFQGTRSTRLVSDGKQTPSFAELFSCPGLQFVRRGDCETDPSLKQLIPYVVVGAYFGDVDHILVYRRAAKAGEARLSGKQSIGIGGHINDGDHQGDYTQTFARAWRRELDEELKSPTLLRPVGTTGYINDDSNDVGRVHFGLTVGVQALSLQIQANTEDICDPHFMAAKRLPLLENAETWTQLLINDFFK